MKRFSLSFLFVYCVLLTVCCKAQDPGTDSLLNLLNTTKHDTTRVNAMNALFLKIEYTDPKKAKEYLDKALKLAKSINYQRGIARAHQRFGFFAENKGDSKGASEHYETAKKIMVEIGDKRGLSDILANIASLCDTEGDFKKGMENYFESLKLRRELGDSADVASSNDDIGNSYFMQGDYSKALVYHFDALRIRESIGDKRGAANATVNIGAVYQRLGNYSEALNKYLIAVLYYKSIGDKKVTAICLNNIGVSYYYLGDQEQALKNHTAALKLREELKDKRAIATSLNNIGLVHKEKGNYGEAIKNYFASLKIREATGSKSGIASSCLNIGELFYQQKQFEEARRYLEKGKAFGIEIGNKEMLKMVYRDLAKLDSAKGNFKGAFENDKRSVLYKDSLDNEETRKKTIQSQMSYEFEKKEAVAVAEHKKELENQELLAEEKSRKQRLVLIFVLSSLFLVLILSGFIFRSLRTTKKQKNIIEQQKDLVELQKREVEEQKILVEEHQREIIDSINYAKRIQLSQLPTERYIDRSLKRLMVVFCLLCTVYCRSQNPVVDSLVKVLEITKNDTVKINVLNDLFIEYEFADDKKAEDYLNKAFLLAKKLNYKRGLGTVHLHMGFFAEDKGNYPEALKNYFACLKYHEEIGDKNGMASAYNNIGHVFSNQGNYPEALKNIFSSLKIDEAQGNKRGVAVAYGNIAVIYSEQENYSEALKNFSISLKISKEAGDTEGEAGSYNNLGNIYTREGNYVEALKNYDASLKLKKAMGDKRGIGTTYNNIGSVYISLANQETKVSAINELLEVALKNCMSSLEVRESIGDKAGIASARTNIGVILKKQKNYAEAEKYLLTGKDMSIELGYKENLKETYRELMELDSINGNYKGAYENHKLFVMYSDSLDNEETRRKTIQSQMTYDFEKKEAVAQAEHKKELENQELLAGEKSRKQKIILLFVLGSLLLVLVFAGFIFRSLRTTRKQKTIIELQKDLVEKQKDEVEQQKILVEEKQRAIIDSINYARRIQRSLLPTEKYIDKNLKRMNH